MYKRTAAIRIAARRAGAGTGLLYYYASEKERRMREVMRPRSVGRASIGGPFELVGGDGKSITEELLLGHWSLIYFGFTECPDICPAELSKVGEALGILEGHGVRVASKPSEADLTPIFISVDPERDTPEKADEYAKCFHEHFVGLSGSEEQVKKTAKAYRVYYTKDDDEAEDYLVDHSIITYLMDENGEFSEFYGKNVSAVEMAARIEAKMLAHKKDHERVNGLLSGYLSSKLERKIQQ
eukprot:IDg14735t1